MGRHSAVESPVYQDSFTSGGRDNFDSTMAYDRRPVVERCADLTANSSNTNASDDFYSNRTRVTAEDKSGVLVMPPCSEYQKQCREPVVVINNYNVQDEYNSRYDTGYQNGRAQYACNRRYYEPQYNEQYNQYQNQYRAQYYNQYQNGYNAQYYNQYQNPYQNPYNAQYYNQYQNPYNYNQYYNQYQNPYNAQYYNQYQYYNNPYQNYNSCYQGRYYQPYYYNNCQGSTFSNLAGMAISMGLGIAGSAIWNHRYNRGHHNYNNYNNYNNNWYRNQMPFARGRHHC